MVPKKCIMSESQMNDLRKRSRPIHFSERKKVKAQILKANGKQYVNSRGTLIPPKIEPNQVKKINISLFISIAFLFLLESLFLLFRKLAAVLNLVVAFLSRTKLLYLKSITN